jgi:hypothetical protein
MSSKNRNCRASNGPSRRSVAVRAVTAAVVGVVVAPRLEAVAQRPGQRARVD